MFGGLYSFQGKLINNYRASLGQTFSNFQTELSNINWFQRSVDYAKYLSGLAKLDAWFAEWDANSSLSEAYAAEYEAQEAHFQAMRAVKAIISATVLRNIAESEIYAAMSNIKNAESKATSNNEILNSTANLSDQIIDNAQTLIEKVTGNNEAITLDEKARGLVLQSNQGEANIDKSESRKSEQSNIEQEKNKWEKHQEDQEHKKNTYGSNIKVSKDVQEQAMNAVARSTASKEHAISMYDVAINRKYFAEESGYNSDKSYQESYNSLNNYKDKVKTISLTKDLLTNISLVLKNTEKTQINSSDTDIKSSENLSNNLKEISNIEQSLINLDNKDESEDSQQQKSEILEKVNESKSSLKSLIATVLKEKSAKMVLNQDLKEYYNDLSSVYGDDNIIVNQRTESRRGDADRRASLSPEDNNYFENIRNQDDRRQNDRRQDDYSKAIFINSKELLEMVS